ncbi:borealin-like [Homarus americanus]|uniref:Borealin-like n=1 Tax=Homarus americanus TaxID=6706 RepID=A0A8J5MKV7_HOMAM|nr:borealin-like [Homarus americanus]XP_042206595.1 borealin-like [Homarus americanus]KAG7154955.1 Borealin-like [Homarus americanus]
MPQKKRSRVPSRAKPFLSNNHVGKPDLDQEQRKEKLQLLLDDFDREVEKRVEQMEAEMLAIQQHIQHMFKTDLLRYPANTKNMLLVDYMNMNKRGKGGAVRNSMANLICAADTVLESAAKKRGRKPKVLKSDNCDVFIIPPPVPRSTRSCKQKSVLGTSQTDNLLPPPSTSRVQRAKKWEMGTTPFNQNISQKSLSALMVTPKFDPHTPLPPGTIKRRPKVGEVAMSLTGSPLQVSPAINCKMRVQELMADLDDDITDEETKTQLQTIHEKLSKFLFCETGSTLPS